MCHIDNQQAIRNNTGIPTNNATLTERDLAMGVPNWVNRAIVTGDNLDIIRKMNSESVDLIYLDPPFNSNRNYEALVGSAAAGAAFKDTWTLSDLDVAWMGLIADTEPALYRIVETAGLAHGKGMQSYLCMMAVRLIEMRRVLKPTGSIYLHCDPTTSHYLKTLMDAIYGRNLFKNEVVWHYRRWTGKAKRLQRLHDIILFYTKNEDYQYNVLYDPYTERSLERKQHYHTRIKDGDVYVTSIDPKGVRAGDVWFIPVLNSQSKERTGFPTQKPLALLERIIKASSNEGDVVLDPFCGCATACVAADMHNRQWIGIDLSKKAVELVIKRVKDYQGLFQDITHYGGVTSFPDRNDILGVKQSYKEMKHILFGEQEGMCNLCGHDYPYKIFEIDHVVPQSKGGGDHIENRQLLCPPCNKMKSAGTMEAAVTKYQETYANTPFMNASHGAL